MFTDARYGVPRCFASHFNELPTIREIKPRNVSDLGLDDDICDIEFLPSEHALADIARAHPFVQADVTTWWLIAASS